MHVQEQVVAAEAVLATLTARAPLRLVQVSIQGVRYALSPDLDVLRRNRSLLEDVVMTALARHAAASMLGVPVVPGTPERDALDLLQSALVEPEEQSTIPDYVRVLEARARALLRRSWSEVQVVAAGLREHGALDAEAVKHRIRCAQGIRGTLLN